MNRDLMFREQVAAYLTGDGDPNDETVIDVLWTAAVRHVGFGTGFTRTDLDAFHDLLWRNLNLFANDMLCFHWQDSVARRTSVVCMTITTTREQLGLIAVPLDSEPGTRHNPHVGHSG